MANDLIRTGTAARLLGMSQEAVCRRIAQGMLTAHYLPHRQGRKGSHAFILRADLERMATEFPPKPRRVRDYSYAPTEAECAYLAGLIDGEGSIGVMRQVREGITYHRLSLSVFNNDPELLNWVWEKFGGAWHMSKPRGPGCAPHGRWQCGTSMAYSILQKVAPYIRNKSGQAALAISFQERVWAYGAGRGRHVADTEIQWRDEQRAAISKLNLRFRVTT